MKITLRNILVATWVSMFCVYLTVSRPDEKKISKKEIPAAVLKAFKAKYPKAKITGQAKEMRDGKDIYEIECIAGTIERAVLFTPDGSIVEIEESIRPTDLPKPVRESLTAKYPKCTILKAEEINRSPDVVYEVLLKVAKVEKEVVVKYDGTILEDH